MVRYLASSSSDVSAIEIVGDSNPQTLCTPRDERYVCSLISLDLLGDTLRLVCSGATAPPRARGVQTPQKPVGQVRRFRPTLAPQASFFEGIQGRSLGALWCYDDDEHRLPASFLNRRCVCIICVCACVCMCVCVCVCACALAHTHTRAHTRTHAHTH